MSDPTTKLHAHLRQHGYSRTASRQTVFNALLGREPLSMAELAAACLPAIDRSSLYRTIDLFEQVGIVQRLRIGWKYKLELSDEFQPHHHHIVCLRCARMTALPEDKNLEARLHEAAAQAGFTMTDHQLELRGTCTACRRTAATA